MAGTAGGVSETALSEYLQDLVMASSDVEQFLQELVVFSAARLSEFGQSIHCGITLLRRKKPVSIASSDQEANRLDELQNRFGDGPCLTAIREQQSILVPEVAVDSRWPEYMGSAREHGVGSVLAVPFVLEGEAGAALNLYAGSAHVFSAEAIDHTERYALRSSKALTLSVRLTQLTDARDNLRAAMESRTTIDLAVGVVMGQNRCSQEAAFKILRNASSSRNRKLRDVAADVVATASGGTEAETRFEERTRSGWR